MLTSPAPAAGPFELVEHKGLGHPDSVCDALAEAASRRLSQFYFERFGHILHHNLDKALLCGGAARAEFGGGEVLAPIEIYLAGRATTRHRGVVIPVEELAVEAAREWLGSNLRHLDVARDVRLIPKIRTTSSELQTLFGENPGIGVARANDTSLAVGFAPFDALEKVVSTAGRVLNEPGVRREFPWVGEDIKVMGARVGDRITLTVACAMVGRAIANIGEYFANKASLTDFLAHRVRQETGFDTEVAVNAADGDSQESVYVTVTGLSAEAGDDGQVGRGNRVNGLITPYRPMSLEAAAGKNPVSHVGKLYNVMAHRIAAVVVREMHEVEAAYCYLLSRIGRPIDEPALFDLKVALLEQGTGPLSALAPRIAELALAEFSTIGSLWREALAGILPVY